MDPEAGGRAVSATEARAAYIAGGTASTVVNRLQPIGGLTLSSESRARILTGIRDLLVPEIEQALEQEQAGTR